MLRQCDRPWHLGCLTPPLVAIPDGEWFCPECTRDPGAPIGDVDADAEGQQDEDEDEDEEQDDDDDDSSDGTTGRKRKAPTRKAAGTWSCTLVLFAILKQVGICAASKKKR